MKIKKRGGDESSAYWDDMMLRIMRWWGEDQ
jgi:hypothetical protein